VTLVESMLCTRVYAFLYKYKHGYRVNVSCTVTPNLKHVRLVSGNPPPFPLVAYKLVSLANKLSREWLINSSVHPSTALYSLNPKSSTVYRSSNSPPRRCIHSIYPPWLIRPSRLNSSTPPTASEYYNVI
jgi:hypothetical protein